MVAVASDVDSQLLDAVRHLLSFEHPRQFGRGEAVAREGHEGTGVLFAQLLDVGVEVDET